METIGNLLHTLSESVRGVTDHPPDHVLDFSGQGLRVDTEDDAKPIVEAIHKCKNMTVLKLYGNSFSPAGCKAIGKALESHPEFQHAHWKDIFTGRMKEEIPDALRSLSGGMMLADAKLVELDLSDNAFGPIGVEGLVVLLKSTVCYTLQELKLNNNGLGVTGGKLLAEALNTLVLNAINAGTPLKLKTFICGRNRQENEGAKALASFLGSVGTLEVVDMPQNGIYHPGIQALCGAFAKNPNLRAINMNDNTFTEKGAAHFGDILKNLRNLESLNLGDCLLRSDGAGILANALKGNAENLKKLVLSSNEIGLRSALELVDSIKDKELDLLDLNGNAFGEQGCIDIINRVDDLGLKDALVLELEDDEGSEDEDSEEDRSYVYDEEEEEAEEEEYEDVEEGEIEGEEDLNEVTPAPFTQEEEVSVAELLEKPSLPKLSNFAAKGSEEIIMYLKAKFDIFPANRESLFVQNCVLSASKLATLLNPTSPQAEKDMVLKIGKELLKAAFEKAREENSLSILNNTIVLSLGLIKSEDKKFRVTGSLFGPMLVLEEMMRESLVPQATRDTLKSFLLKGNPALDMFKQQKMQLIQSVEREM